ncbi:unnamed protein product [Dicrocoelium dendriticum]|nr:unnamed protein product [Dicrocoelium dendriticum]
MKEYEEVMQNIQSENHTNQHLSELAGPKEDVPESVTKSCETVSGSLTVLHSNFVPTHNRTLCADILLNVTKWESEHRDIGESSSSGRWWDVPKPTNLEDFNAEPVRKADKMNIVELDQQLEKQLRKESEEVQRRIEELEKARVEEIERLGRIRRLAEYSGNSMDKGCTEDPFPVAIRNSPLEPTIPTAAIAQPKSNTTVGNTLHDNADGRTPRCATLEASTRLSTGRPEDAVKEAYRGTSHRPMSTPSATSSTIEHICGKSASRNPDDWGPLAYLALIPRRASDSATLRNYSDMKLLTNTTCDQTRMKQQVDSQLACAPCETTEPPVFKCMTTPTVNGLTINPPNPELPKLEHCGTLHGEEAEGRFDHVLKATLKVTVNTAAIEHNGTPDVKHALCSSVDKSSASTSRSRTEEELFPAVTSPHVLPFTPEGEHCGRPSEEVEDDFWAAPVPTECASDTSAVVVTEASAQCPLEQNTSAKTSTASSEKPTEREEALMEEWCIYNKSTYRLLIRRAQRLKPSKHKRQGVDGQDKPQLPMTLNGQCSRGKCPTRSTSSRSSWSRPNAERIEYQLPRCSGASTAEESHTRLSPNLKDWGYRERPRGNLRRHLKLPRVTVYPDKLPPQISNQTGWGSLTYNRPLPSDAFQAFLHVMVNQNVSISSPFYNPS